MERNRKFLNAVHFVFLETEIGQVNPVLKVTISNTDVDICNIGVESWVRYI